MSDTPSGGGIGHILSANKNRVGNTRVDKIEADAMSKIVERIAGVNPSDPWGQKKSDPTPAPPPRQQQPTRGPAAAVESSSQWGNSPLHQMRAAQPDAQVQFLAQKVAFLEQRLAKYEVFNGSDNDVVSATTTPAKDIDRGADSSAYGNGAIRKKNAKTKDPVDGKPDGQAGKKEGQMAGERINILGMSMTEWRSLANLPEPAVDLTQRRVNEAYEDEIEETAATRAALRDIGVSGKGVQEPKPPPSSPEARKAAGMKPLPAARGGSTVASRGAMADVRKLASMGRKANEEYELWAGFLSFYDTTPEQFAQFAEAAHENDDVDAIEAILNLEDTFHAVIGLMSEDDDGDEDNEVEQLWAEWLESHDLSVDQFNMLVDNAETDEEFSTLEALQSMFEAEFKVGPYVTKTTSLNSNDIKPASKVPDINAAKLARMKAVHDKYMASKTKTEDDDAFECDADMNGDPDMDDPAWKRLAKKARRKS
jgi:hypothetical protein